jgi:hypothetical protein
VRTLLVGNSYLSAHNVSGVYQRLVATALPAVPITAQAVAHDKYTLRQHAGIHTLPSCSNPAMTHAQAMCRGLTHTASPTLLPFKHRAEFTRPVCAEFIRPVCALDSPSALWNRHSAGPLLLPHKWMLSCGLCSRAFACRAANWFTIPQSRQWTHVVLQVPHRAITLTPEPSPHTHTPDPSPDPDPFSLTPQRTHMVLRMN